MRVRGISNDFGCPVVTFPITVAYRDELWHDRRT
jgi:hypothetical protein